MKRVVLPIVLLAAGALSQEEQSEKVPPAVHCNDELADCREDCTLSFGTSLKTRDRFAQCITRCKQRDDDCRERHLEVHRNQLNPEIADKPKREPDSPKPPTSSESSEEPPRRSEAARSDLPSDEPASEATRSPESPKKAEPKPELEPKPAKKKEEKPAEKKRPLDEWDPDAFN